MTRAAFYPAADASAQNFAKTYKGSTIQPNVVVLHTTEGMSFPPYGGGATAPHLTAKPNLKTKRLEWRQHFPLTMSARALRNESGGVETNTLNCVQVELVGSCDPPNNKQGWFFWPEAPEWALDEVAKFIAWMHVEWALQFKAPTFLPYPSSYGASKVRMSGSRWQDFYGVCGHQHVPENSHGDPGNLDVPLILKKAKAIVTPPKSEQPTYADRVVNLAEAALKTKGNQSKARKPKWQAIIDNAKDLQS